MTLKELRISKKLTQQQAADLLQISRRTYIAYEQGKTKQTSPKYKYIFSTLEDFNRLDETHGILNAEEIKEICSAILKEYEVDACYLFGSYAKGKANEQSDVDLLVFMPIRGTEYYDLAERLRDELHKKVDLLHETQLNNNPDLAKEIMKEGIKIYG